MKLSASDYANTIIDGLMGYKPAVDGEMNPFMADSDRHFYGKLKNLRHGDNTFSLEASSHGIELLKKD